MLELVALLDRWSELEPDCCKPISSRDYQRQNFQLDCGEIESIVLNRQKAALLNPLSTLDMIAGAVQRAIAAKPDWEMLTELHRHGADGAPEYMVMVWRQEDEAEGFTRIDREPAIALLETYVAALKASNPAIAPGGNS